VIQPDRLALVEDRQAVKGMSGQADHIRHRQQTAPTRERLTFSRFKIVFVDLDFQSHSSVN